MKREYLFIIVLIIILILGMVIKSMFINSVKEETQNELTKLQNAKALYLKDSLVQKEVNLTKKVFISNKDDNRPVGVKVGTILGTIESILKDLKITYNQNDLKPRTEAEKNGVYNLYFVDLNFKTSFEKYIKFIELLEKNNEIIDIVSMKVTRSEDESKKDDNQKNLNVDLVIQFLKIT